MTLPAAGTKTKPKEKQAGKQEEKQSFPFMQWVVVVVNGFLSTGFWQFAQSLARDKETKWWGVRLVFLAWTLAFITVVPAIVATWFYFFPRKHGRNPKLINTGRVFLRMPLASGDIGKLKKHLRAIHTRAILFLGTRFKNRSIADRNIRMNVFFPDYRNCLHDNALHLKVHDDLCLEMRHPSELQLKFQPGEAATGRAYRDGKTQLWHKLTGTNIWMSGSESCELTEEQIKLIHKNLDWVISFPIMDGERALGALNLDGLEYPLSEEDIYELAQAISPEAVIFVERCKRLPLVTLAVCEEDRKNE
jgi:hypothetical protein